VSNVGRYQVVRRLGSGGMAEVLEADAIGEAGFVRRVAIKRMLGTAGEDPSFARMFLDEARIASRLHHANIVAILDYGVVDGAPFQVLELVDGVDARTMVRRATGGTIPVDVALYVVAQIGHALAAAHEATDASGEPLGLVHRDVSPGNILLSWDGDVKLADFGIAFAKDKSEKTEAGTTKGTLVYMSPEQATGGRLDRRADVFSLGCVLHTLVTGASPLADEGWVRLHATQRLRLAPGLPEDVHSIIEIATQFDVEQRFQSAIALTEAVGRALASRIDREPRRRLVEYLTPLRRPAAEKQGRLDELARVEMVRVANDPTVREFHAAARAATVFDEAATRIEDGADVPPPPPGAQTRTSTAGTVPRPLRGAGIAVAALLVVLGGVGTWIVGRRHVPAAGLVSPATSASVADAPQLVASSPPTSDAPASAPPSPSPSPSPSASLTVQTRKPVAAAHATPSTPSSPSPPIITTASAASAAGTERCLGTVYLSCPLAPRAEISIDGAPTALHHGNFVELPCAGHAILFQLPDGRRSAQAAAPTSANTRTSPLELRCRLE
jgi:hypothetical protein